METSARCGYVELVCAATRIPEAEPHPENVVFVIEMVSFSTCYGHVKGGVHDPSSMEPIYV